MICYQQRDTCQTITLPHLNKYLERHSSLIFKKIRSSLHSFSIIIMCTNNNKHTIRLVFTQLNIKRYGFTCGHI